MRIDRDGPRPGQDELNASWLTNLGKVGEFAAAERWFCELAITG